jgi:hypothetical protein
VGSWSTIPLDYEGNVKSVATDPTVTLAFVENP